VQGSRLPEITLSLPAALGLLTLFLAIGAVLVYVALQQTAPAVADATASPTITPTETATLTPTPVTPTVTNTPEPSPTPLSYTVKLGDNCGTIAYAFGVSINSIVLLNDLPADCSTLFENQKLLIPQPTPTATSMPTSTLNPAEATEAACEKYEITVEENDTLSSIALNYNVSMDAIKEYNGLVNDVVRFGQPLVIPLCRRNATPGPSPTPTMPPPYSAVPLLLPPDGAAFSIAEPVISLQWASVGSLREKEAYAVTIEDLTEGEGRKMVEYVTDTKFIVPSSFLSNESVPHVFRWWIVPVRQMGTDTDGNPIWEPAGAVSLPRVFTWFGVAPASTPVPN
jgi:LysM repeat protein